MNPKEITHASERGQRSYQEDRALISNSVHGTLLAVFDGHGGDTASEYCEKNFVSLFIEAMDMVANPRIAFISTFSILAARLRPYYEGTTASVVFIPLEGGEVWTAVLGDSPIIIGGSASLWYGPDHNVRSNLAEASAAEMRGGFINSGYVYRSLSGVGLQMGRALGDSELGKVISNKPEIASVPVWPGDFILVATDGLFDPTHRNFKDSTKVILAKIEQGEPAEGLVKFAIEAKTGDNVTAILARL